MNITSLMLSFLIHLQSQDCLDLFLASEAQDSPNAKIRLVDQFIDHNQWELYVCMDEAIDAFVEIEKQRKINYNKEQKIAI